MEQKLIELKGEVDKPTIVGRGFNTLLLIIDRTIGQKDQ